MPVAIRPFEARDYPALAALYQTVDAEGATSAEHLRFLDESRPEAFALERALHTGLTGVLKAYRRQGIAKALKLRTIAYAKRHGYALLRTIQRTRLTPLLKALPMRNNRDAARNFARTSLLLEGAWAQRTSRRRSDCYLATKTTGRALSRR